MDAKTNADDRSSESNQPGDNAGPQTPVGNEQGVNREASAQPRQNKESNGIPRKWEIGIGAFLAVVNFAALFIYGYQLVEMRKATKAATDGLTLTREMNRLDQRAWVSTTAVIGGVPEEGKEFNISVGMKNTGKTYASNVKAAGCTRVVPAWGAPIFADAKTTTPISVGILTPNGDYSINRSSPTILPKFTKAEVDGLMSGTVRLFVYGIITYDDIFKCHHWTTFCFFFDPSTKTYPAYIKHNSADDCQCGDECLPPST